MVHKLKTWPREFSAVMDGTKRHEWRKDDRGFEIGDSLILKEWVPGNGKDISEGNYTGRALHVDVTYITRGFGVPKGWVVMTVAVKRFIDVRDEVEE